MEESEAARQPDGTDAAKLRRRAEKTADRKERAKRQAYDNTRFALCLRQIISDAQEKGDAETQNRAEAILKAGKPSFLSPNDGLTVAAKNKDAIRFAVYLNLGGNPHFPRISDSLSAFDIAVRNRDHAILRLIQDFHRGERSRNVWAEEWQHKWDEPRRDQVPSAFADDEDCRMVRVIAQHLNKRLNLTAEANRGRWRHPRFKGTQQEPNC